MDDTGIFGNAYDDEDVGTEADLNNLETTMNISDEHAMMDVKSAFLYGTIEEEVYVFKPPSFEDPQFPNKVYKVEKALYGLHQAPRAWYETLSTYIIENGFRRGIIDKTLFIKKDKGDILLVQVYVDDIIFGFTKKSLCDEFEGLMHKEFQMSSIGELTFFLGLQIASTLMEPIKALVKDEEADSVDVHLFRSMIGSLMYLTASRLDIMFAVYSCAKFQVTPKIDSPFDLEAFSNSDYAGASLDRKSTIGGCQFLGKRLISWQCKKQTIVANSTTEAEYVVAANCCGQVIKIHIDLNVADLLTKAFDVSRFNFLVASIGLELKDKKELAIPGQTTTGKEFSNLLMAGSLPKTISAKTRSERVLEEPNEPPLPEGHKSGSEEGRMEHTFKLIDNVPPTSHDSSLTGEKEGCTSCRDPQTKAKSQENRKKEEVKHPTPKKEDIQADNDFDDLDDLVDEGMTFIQEKDTKNQGVSTASPRTPPITTIVFDDEDVTMAMTQTLIKMKEEKAKAKGVAIKDVEDSSRPIRSITTPQPLPTIDPKDKELAQRLHEEELAELDRSQKDKQRQEEATNVALAEEFNEIQAKMDADHELAVRLIHEEQEKYTIEERATLLAEYFEKRKKQMAAERAEAIRNKPPIRAQVRNKMITYLKHMGKYTHQQLKHKTLEELQKLYQKEQKWINDFKPMDSEEDGSNTKKAGKRIKRIADSTSKQKSPKKSKVIKEQESAESNEEAAADYEQEKEELRMWLAVVPDEDETVDPEILSVKYPIVDWESQNLGSVDMEDIHVYKIIRADGNTSYHKTFSSMLRRFDRQDLMDLHRLVMKRFEDNTPEGYNLLLWGDIKGTTCVSLAPGVTPRPNSSVRVRGWSNTDGIVLSEWLLLEEKNIVNSEVVSLGFWDEDNLYRSVILASSSGHHYIAFQLSVPVLQLYILAAVNEYCIPLDLHPRLLPPGMMMNRLLSRYIGLYIEQLEQGGLRVPFSSFFLAVIRHFSVHFLQLVLMVVDRGHWFSFENKTGCGTKKYLKEVTSSLKGWKKKFFLLDRHAILDAMPWRYGDTDFHDDFLTTYNENDDAHLSEFLVPLRPPP
ncbi:putative ribonuclease H-like domain-containing protein [Tanacetum coccineum]